MVKNIYGHCIAMLLLIAFISCEKLDIEFGTTTAEADPNITYFDNYATDIATYKTDSFLTSGHNVFCIGYHNDPVFGIVKAGSFAQISMPTYNPVANVDVSFDSLELVLKPNGAFYGDSSLPLTINVYSLTENIKDDVNGDAYYNTSTFSFNPNAIGQQTITPYAKTGKDISIKLSAALGQEWLNKFKTSNDDVSTVENFINYFKGIYITTDTVNTKSLLYFTTGADSMFIRLHYHENGLFAQSKQLNFGFTSAKQFNNIGFTHTNGPFTAFVNKKKQLIASTSSNNQSFLNTNLGACVKISFPSLLNLKELHPYISVVKALLIIKPDISSSAIPYQLPTTLSLYQTATTNELGLGIYNSSTTNPALQTGDLVIDNLYGENTYYNFDITQYINTKIAEGQFSNSALLLYPTLSNADGGIQRLILNDQTKNQSVQLKLYVLGL